VPVFSGLVAGFVAGVVAGVVAGFIAGVVAGFIAGVIAGFIAGLIAGFILGRLLFLLFALGLGLALTTELDVVPFSCNLVAVRMYALLLFVLKIPILLSARIL